MRTSLSTPSRFFLLATGTWLALFFLTRLILFATHLDEAGTHVLSTFAIGLLYDLVFLAYAAVPLGLYLLKLLGVLAVMAVVLSVVLSRAVAAPVKAPVPPVRKRLAGFALLLGRAPKGPLP